MKNALLCVCIILALASCGGDDSGEQVAGAVKASKAGEVAAQKDQKSSCIADYIDKPCELLTQQVVSESYALFTGQAEPVQELLTHSCIYSWESGGRMTTMKIGANKYDVPVDNEIAIKWIKEVSIKDNVKRFKNAHRALSKEELARIAEVTQKEIEKRSADMSESQKKMVSGMGKGMGSSMKYSQVDGVGSAAAWGTVSKVIPPSLKVLDGDVEFEIAVNISDDDLQNQKVAGFVAKAVIQLCQ